MSRGRNRELIEARDRRLFERYYYWTEVKRLRFDDTVRKLSREEFYISESRVLQIVREQIQSGATVDGKEVRKPLFTGFRIPAKHALKQSSTSVSEPSLFPESNQ